LCRFGERPPFTDANGETSPNILKKNLEKGPFDRACGELVELLRTTPLPF